MLATAGSAAGSDVPIALGAGPICPQMAATLPLQPPGKYQKNQNAWRFDTRAGIAGVFKGSVATRVGAGPVDETDGSAWQRAASICQSVNKGAECRIEGPVVFFVEFDDRSFRWRFDAGEKALFRVRGTVLECEEMAAVHREDADV
jgi:hypothetical protein